MTFTLNSGFWVPGGPFDPTSIAGLTLWFKADSGPMTSGSPSVNNDLVDTWTDQSASAKNLTAATTARPTFKTNIVNTLPVVRFDGSANTMPTASMTLSQPLSYFVVISITSGSNGKYPWDGKASTDKAAVSQQGASGLGLLLSSGSLACANDWGLSTFRVVTAVYNGASSSHQVNNGTPVTGNAGAGNPSGITVGSNQGGTFGFSAVDVAEILIYNSVLSAGNVTNVNQYLGTKYGISF